ncbi:MAG: stage V sporulation protein AA [Romboutsia sp.]|uniref:stage V sporulation protein AA n=1 Tax=Romboutsia sp. TaxID=1965302 RepID=UPI003F40D954
MEEIYLIPKKTEPFNINNKKIYLKDIFCVYPENQEDKIYNILLREYSNNKSKYDVIHIGEVIEAIKKVDSSRHINFLRTDDVIIYFDNGKKDRTKYLRVFIVSIIVLMGSIMGIMNFHADVNMDKSQLNMVTSISKNPEKYLQYFQIPYSIGIGVGVAIFFNKFIPTYAKDEPSPLDLRISSLNKEIENQLRHKGK